MSSEPVALEIVGQIRTAFLLSHEDSKRPLSTMATGIAMDSDTHSINT